MHFHFKFLPGGHRTLRIGCISLVWQEVTRQHRLTSEAAVSNSCTIQHENVIYCLSLLSKHTDDNTMVHFSTIDVIKRAQRLQAARLQPALMAISVGSNNKECIDKSLFFPNEKPKKMK